MHLCSNDWLQNRLRRQWPCPLPPRHWPGSPALASPLEKWGRAAWALGPPLEHCQAALQLLRLSPLRWLHHVLARSAAALGEQTPLALVWR